MSKLLLIGGAIIIIGIGAFLFFMQDDAIDQVGAPTPTPTPTIENGDAVPTPTPTPAEENGDAVEIVSYTNNGFTPNTITIAVGETVAFENDSSGQMWIASDPHPAHTAYPEFDSRRGVSAGEIYEFTFDRPGQWGYHNHLSPQHVGTIIVE